MNRLSQALVRYSASNLESVIAELKVNQTQLLAGYEVKIADGNHLSGTEHRLKVLRDNLAKALPGKSTPRLLESERVFLPLPSPPKPCMKVFPSHGYSMRLPIVLYGLLALNSIDY